MRNDERLRTIYEVMAPYIVRNEHNWRDYLAFASQFHKHSFDNILLVYAQDEDVSILATRKQWAAIGRNLIPRAKGVAVCVYRNAKLTLDYLFDVSQTMVKNQKMIRQSDRPLDINDCIPESSQYNYENQFLVLKPGVSSKGKDMTADDSIWYARNGFGCIYGARGQAVYAESLLTGKYIHWERHDFCGIVKPESLKEWLLDKPVRNEAAEELTKFVTPELISAAKQNHTACGYPFLIGYAPAEGGLHEAFCLDPDPVNLASFIVKMGKERGDLMICTPLDTPFLNTVGMFTDQCVDFDFLQDHLLPVLIPMQMGKTEPQEIKLTEDQDNEAFLDDFAVEDDMEL